MKLSSLLICCALALSWSCGCSSHQALVAAPERPVPTDGTGYFAGKAVADITPPLHLSLFGHGPEGRIATGVRLRLRCQVFVIAQDAELLALVPCDLQSPSMLLQRRVARRLWQLGIPIRAHRIFLMATHTHGAPGHYFEARRYSGPFSSSAPGHDPKVLEFLVTRIANAVLEAFNTLTPACIGWGQVELRGLTFNRAYVPFLANHGEGKQDQELLRDANRADQQSAQVYQGRAPLPGANQREPKSAQLDQEPKPSGAANQPEPKSAPVDPVAHKPDDEDDFSGPETAVDPRLSVLRFDRRERGSEQCKADGPPLGVLAVYGMHPTGIPNTNELYHGDIFGFATRTAEACLSQSIPRPGRPERSPALSWRDAKDEAGTEAKPPRGCDDPVTRGSPDVVVGLANGIEGDVSPNLNFQSVRGARRLGRKLGLEIAKVAANVDKLWPKGDLDRAYWELSFPNGQYGSGDAERLCPHGELGMVSAGGAHDGPTRLRVITEANAGFRLHTPDPCHGHKLALRVGLGHSEHNFPTRGPISLLRIGPAVLATVPAEVTTVVGTRIRERLANTLGTQSIAVVGLTNQYFQYITSKEEYPYQFYEGASTLYGPHSSDFLIRHFDCLAQALLHPGSQLPCRGQAPINKAPTLITDPAPEVSRMPDDEHVSHLIIKNPEVDETWFDGDEGWQMEFPRLPLDFTSDRGKLRVLVLQGATGETVVDDDQGSAIEVREVDDGDSWRVRWTPFVTKEDGGSHRCGKTFRLAVRGRFQFESMAFKLRCREAARGGAR
jgi:hypothetical protein